MSILIDEGDRVVIQGITGRRGRRMTSDMLGYGTHVVAGVSPGHAGESVDGVPVFDFVADAVAATGADTALILVPGLPHGSAAVVEAALAGIRLAAWLADPVPVHDMLRLSATLAGGPMRLIGPNSPGVISPGRCKLGFMPSHCYRPGPVGVLSKSGSLSYEVCLRLTEAGIGQSTVVGVGGDPIKGLGVVDAALMFDEDPDTRVILALGEIGGTEEYQLAQAVADGTISKPVVSLLVGATAPPGRKLGHAGALIFSDRERLAPKVAALRDAGVSVVESLTDVVGAVGNLASEMEVAG